MGCGPPSEPNSESTVGARTTLATAIVEGDDKHPVSLRVTDDQDFARLTDLRP